MHSTTPFAKRSLLATLARGNLFTKQLYTYVASITTFAELASNGYPRKSMNYIKYYEITRVNLILIIHDILSMRKMLLLSDANLAYMFTDPPSAKAI